MGQLQRIMFALILVVCVAGCGGGGSPTPPAVRGVAATGKALGNAAVTVIDSQAAVKTATTSAAGRFSINVYGMTAPYVVKVDAGAGRFLYSFADDAGTANVNPFSDLVVRSACGGAAAETSHGIIRGNLAGAVAQLKARFGIMLTTYHVPNDFDPLHSAYSIGNALDRLFDAITVTVAGDGASVTITNTATGATIYIATITSSGAFGGTVADANVPTPSTRGNESFTTTPKVAAGYYASMALKADGSVWAWGNNNDGQLGDGTTASRTTPIQVHGLGNIVDIRTGDNTPIAMKNDGTVWIWGRDQRHADHTTMAAPSLTTPQQLPGLSQVTAIAAGHSHGVALKSDGTVWWWGRDSYPITFATAPAQIAGLTGVKSISAYYALKTDGTVWTLNFATTPEQVTALSGISSLMELGAGAMVPNGGQYAIKSDGTVWSLGTTVAEITTISGLTAISDSISGGLNYPIKPTVALKADGTVWNWGGDETAIQVSSLAGITGISVGLDYVLALEADGTIWAWGNNFSGALGDGTTTNRATPVRVSGLRLR
ncbi:RCC1 domain-containing protein [Geomonas anaerohicana]|uniref:Alpha-tubulin suppressor-like RCC1 family protein n=1 Tax=Geomonas anaerohicana TaxID=2798583 RepID=A0ABS0Y9S6_9BACT|nr:hypothetical protein [Geomonas anaerohicana]MBJ6749058.1 hypothetical protein [Geomonas anaerohicana]